MPYLIALVLIWVVPLGAFVAYLVAVNDADAEGLLLTSYLGLFLGVPLAVVLTALVLPVIALAQAADAWERRRRRRRTDESARWDVS
ncbi:hypothetical protein [Nocardioides sp.]|uniref:hypothetical protein n=1 Tax=Nocardioides sp. TaxID=35761 RepID=UPI00271EDE56|nr:hypothetical protein [Nocardioides sp.]MDO9457080.1 hypothetical protein [Nocardioides sp.]